MKRLITLLLALVICFSLAACTQAKKEPATTLPPETTTEETTKPPEGAPVMELLDKAEWETEFSFVVNDKAMTNTELQSLDKWRAADKEIMDAKGKVTTHTFEGYLLKDVLKAAGVAKATKVKLLCSDGYELEYALDDVNTAYTMIAVTKDGEAAATGVFFAPCAERTTTDFASGVVKITTE